MGACGLNSSGVDPLVLNPGLELDTFVGLGHSFVQNVDPVGELDN